MEAPWVRISSKLSRITFEQQPPRLVRWGFHASSLDPLMIGVTENGVLCRIEFTRGRKAAEILEEWKKPGRALNSSKIKKRPRKSSKQIFGKNARRPQIANDRHKIPADGLERIIQSAGRRNHQLCRACPPHQATESGACRRQCHGRQSDTDCGSLPPGACKRRKDRRFRRRS